MSLVKMESCVITTTIKIQDTSNILKCSSCPHLTPSSSPSSWLTTDMISDSFSFVTSEDHRNGIIEHVAFFWFDLFPLAL